MLFRLYTLILQYSNVMVVVAYKLTRTIIRKAKICANPLVLIVIVGLNLLSLL